MNPEAVPAGTPVDLSGSPRERGRQQAENCPDMVGAVQRAVEIRMSESEGRLSSPGVRDLLEELRRFHEDHDPEIMEELRGIGAGFGIPAVRLFDYLMMSLVDDLDPAGDGLEECTAFAAAAEDGGAILAKNRDYRHEHVAIQRVFRHRDPGWGGREVLCVGSLGSPGNFSSGMNSDGFAVADTASRTHTHRVGRHRYFLLTRLVNRCATVAEALSEIAATPHAGGGVLVLGDATGCVATVELGANAQAIEIRHEGRLGRANHFVAELTAGLNRRGGNAESRHRNSEGRLSVLRRLLKEESRGMTVESAAGILSYRGQNGEEAICRKGGRDLSETVSGSIFATAQGYLWFANGNPSEGCWTRFAVHGGTG